jgi:hypothetical protein
MEGSCSTGQSPQWAVVPVEEEEEEEDEEEEEEGNITDLIKYLRIGRNLSTVRRLQPHAVCTLYCNWPQFVDCTPSAAARSMYTVV